MDSQSFMRIVVAITELADFLVYCAIAYSGYVWMFGDKTKAIERLLGASTGYLIIRQADVLRDFLRSL